jgi:hypothetical protein
MVEMGSCELVAWAGLPVSASVILARVTGLGHLAWQALFSCVRVRVHVCACACACVRACVCVCVQADHSKISFLPWTMVNIGNSHHFGSSAAPQCIGTEVVAKVFPVSPGELERVGGWCFLDLCVAWIPL